MKSCIRPIITLAILAALPTTLLARADHLLISEVLINAPGSSATENYEQSAEFVEIYNPTALPVSLKNYILTDYSNYHLLPSTAFDFDSDGDYMLRFPSSATLAPGQLAVVVLDAATFYAEAGTTFGGTAAGFSAQNGEPLLFEIKNSDPAVPEMINLKTDVPNENSFFKSDSGEFVALIYWDGATDLVSDVDMVRWGSPIGSNVIINKSGVSVDGPDPDSISSTYKTDARPDHFNFLGTPEAIARTTVEETFEPVTGGNGLTGHDETRENLAATFVTRANTEISPGIAHSGIPPASVKHWMLY